MTKKMNRSGARSAHEFVMQLAMGAWASRCICEVTRLDIPDLLKRVGPLTAEQLVDGHGVEADVQALHRVMRASASLGVFSEDDEGRFGATVMSQALISEGEGSVKKLVELFGGFFWDIWGKLDDALATGQAQAKSALGEDFWSFLESHPSECELFAAGMKSNSDKATANIVSFCEFSGDERIVDIGGGLGSLAIQLLRRYEGQRAVVLELPDVVAGSHEIEDGLESEVANRLEFHAGDMFSSVPEADVFVLKHIIHNWDDEHVVRLLRNCRGKMTESSRLIAADYVLPPLGDRRGSSAKLLDLHMLLSVSGKERTEEEWRQLFAQADLRIDRVMVPEDDSIAVIEARIASRV